MKFEVGEVKGCFNVIANDEMELKLSINMALKENRLVVLNTTMGKRVYLNPNLIVYFTVIKD